MCGSYILRMGPEHKIRQSVYEMYKAPTEGNLLVDVSAVDSWRELRQRTMNKEVWREWIQSPKVKVTIGPHKVESTEFSFTISN